MWNSPGFSKLTSNYTDLLFDPAANAEWCEFIADEDPRHRRRSRDRGEADPEGPPLRREAAAVRHRLLRDVQPAERRRSSTSKQTPIVRMTETRDRDGRRRAASSTSSCGRPASTSAPARSRAWGSAAATASRSRTTGPTVRRRSSACRPRGFPNFFFPGGPHAAAGNNPRYNGDQVDFVTDTLVYVRDHGYDTIEVDPAAEERWTEHDRPRRGTPPSFGESSYFFGTNIPGKPRKYLLNSARPAQALHGDRRGRANDYKAFRLSRTSMTLADDTTRPGPASRPRESIRRRASRRWYGDPEQRPATRACSMSAIKIDRASATYGFASVA